MIVSVMPLAAEHWNAVRAIYLEGINTGDATFEKTAPEWDKWDQSHMHACRLVAVSEGEVVGWAALSPVSGRCVYAGVAEISVYVAERARGRRVGLALLKRLIMESEHEGVWMLQAGIFPENTASIELHKRVGFRVVGTRERLGCMDGRLRDVVLMERRSRTVGL